MSEPNAQPIRFTCPSCRRSIKAPPSAAGTRARCPNCQISIVVPELPGSGQPPRFVFCLWAEDWLAGTHAEASARLLQSLLVAETEKEFRRVRHATFDLFGKFDKQPFVFKAPCTLDWFLSNLVNASATDLKTRLNRLSLALPIFELSKDDASVPRLQAEFTSVLQASNWSDGAAAQCLQALGWQPEVADRVKFAVALGEYDRAVKECGPSRRLKVLPSLLVPLLRHRDRQTRRSAAQTLTDIQWRPANAAERLAYALAEGRYGEIAREAEALTGVRPPVNDAERVLFKLTRRVEHDAATQNGTVARELLLEILPVRLGPFAAGHGFREGFGAWFREQPCRASIPEWPESPQDGEIREVAEAVEALGKMGDVRAIGQLIRQLGAGNKNPMPVIVVQALTAILEMSRGSASVADLADIAKLPAVEWIWNEEVHERVVGEEDIYVQKVIKPRHEPVDCKRLKELAREELQRRQGRP